MSVIEIERSIIKKFRKEIWCPFVKSVKQYELLKEGDRVAVCISGGKAACGAGLEDQMIQIG